jgi:anti-sigma factor RsiW
MGSTPDSPTEEMACRELVAVVTDYLEGTLPEVDRRRLERHLAECRYCAKYVTQMRATVGALGGLGAESIAPETRRELLEAFRGWRER